MKFFDFFKECLIFRVYALITLLISNLKFCIGHVLWGWKRLNKSDLPLYVGNTKAGVCHIIGSGWSAADSVKDIDFEKDYVVGFNFSGLMSIDFDLYLYELCSDDERRFKISKAQKLLVHKLKVEQSGAKFFAKNLWESKNSIFSFARHYGGDVVFLNDCATKITGDKSAGLYARALLSSTSKVYVQSISTVLICVDIAVQLGFKNIKLHGIDFGGPHFYDDHLPSDPLVGRILSLIKKEKPVALGDVHKTNTGRYSLSDALVFLKKTLAQSGVDISVANKLSPAFKVLHHDE
ncbi:hypothetical protein UIA24_21305 [Pseudomonas sp. AL 58]|uniref:hypothetical protein n=1 Tax=Pseudomonas sp. AL 58 TaxID=3104275 RepID=UPI002EB24773|nr:hypothetical protein [Pseudomonas sp. AL 58]